MLETALEASVKESNLDQNQSVDTETAVDDVRTEFTSIETAVGELSDEIYIHPKRQMPVSSVIGYKYIVGKLVVRIDTDIKIKVRATLAISEESSDPQYSNTRIRLKLRNFVQEQKDNFDSSAMILVKKSVKGMFKRTSLGCRIQLQPLIQLPESSQRSKSF